MGRLDTEHRGARQRERVDMGEMPVIGLAVFGGILAHRRHHDAVGKRQAAQLDRRKQGAHGGVRAGGENSCLYLASHHAFLNRLRYGFEMPPMQRRWYLSSLRGAPRRSNPESLCRAMDCFAEPVIGRAARWLAMTVTTA